MDRKTIAVIGATGFHGKGVVEPLDEQGVLVGLDTEKSSAISQELETDIYSSLKTWIKNKYRQLKMNVMKTKIKVNLAIAILSLFALGACSDDDNSTTVSVAPDTMEPNTIRTGYDGTYAGTGIIACKY